MSVEDKAFTIVKFFVAVFALVVLMPSCMAGLFLYVLGCDIIRVFVGAFATGWLVIMVFFYWIGKTFGVEL